MGSQQNSETASDATGMQVMPQSELSQMQLARVERSVNNIQEAQKILDDIKKRTSANSQLNERDVSKDLEDKFFRANQLSDILEKEMDAEDSKLKKNQDEAQN